MQLYNYMIPVVELYKNIRDTFGCALCATFWLLLHFDVTCGLLLNTHKVKWSLFVKHWTYKHNWEVAF